MRILIVNGHSLTPIGMKKFEFFKRQIIESLKQQKELIDTDNEFYFRDRENLDDFLFEEETSYIRKDAASQFDQIDMVFIQGDANLRPWSQSGVKLLILLRMCMRVKKLVFASSFAFQAIVFLTATNIEKNINIVNGIEGGRLTDIMNVRFKGDLKHSDFFLDNTSGDLYAFKYEQGEWIPRSNVGMHQRKAAQEYQSIGKYIVKAPLYRPKEAPVSDIYKNISTETICRVKTNHIQHYIFQNVPTKFLVSLVNSWDVHSFSFTNSDKTFIPLADSDQGLQIIQYPTILAVQFEINSKYPCTIQILNNFIFQSLIRIRDEQTIGQMISIQHRTIAETQTPYAQLTKQKQIQSKRSALVLIQTRMKGSGFKSPEQEDVETDSNIQRYIAHVGFSLNKQKQPDIVQLNSVWEKKFKVSDQRMKTSQSSRKLISSREHHHSTISPSSFPLPAQEPTQTQTVKAVTQHDVLSVLHPSLPENIVKDVQKQWVQISHSIVYKDTRILIAIGTLKQQNHPQIQQTIHFEQKTHRQSWLVLISCSRSIIQIYYQESESQFFHPKNYQNASNHKFRNQDKSRWVASKDFFV